MAGKKSVQGASLTIEQTNRHHAGTYMCTADNGVGAAVTREITLNILCKLYLIFIVDFNIRVRNVFHT
ncbi:hypothetical protein O3M35_005012 [Rhynocoris fuscipes]|uniref:Immunoglobulin-like beta-sandwich domain-containing protein n=1 Tax=Rhynocoris fuscipes TaxID=488301 RepID=A0AAW1DGL0_9HEMI